MGFLERTIKLGPQKIPYCVPCARMEEKRQALTFLLQGGSPRELFRINRVTMTDPFDQQAKTQLLGDLIFTDKAVIFAQVHEFLIPSGGYGFMFGLLGAIIAQSRANRAKKKALAEVDMMARQMYGSGLNDFLVKTPRLISFPKNAITKLKFTWGSLQIKTPERSHVFVLEKGKKTYQQYEREILGYIQI
jgi:hypothetical protein